MLAALRQLIAVQKVISYLAITRAGACNRTVRFNTSCSDLLTCTGVTYLRRNLPLTAESNTVPYPRYLPHFTAAILPYAHEPPPAT